MPPNCLYVSPNMSYNDRMEHLKELLLEQLNNHFIKATLSGPYRKDGPGKIKVRPVLIKGTLFFQLEIFRDNQVFHENLTSMEACLKLCSYMEGMKQMQLETKQDCYSILCSRKGQVTVKAKAQAWVKETTLSHNREKHYILEEGIRVPFLADLGVMTEEGRIVRSKTDKFRQINRFLEFIEDIVPKLAKGREITVLDFGCGKSYLTFAMYYYLHELKGYDIRIIGLDLKADVIRRCNELSKAYGYKKLEFLQGDIADYEGVREVDMVVTLHACDTATDYALAKAVSWNAQVILSVPCCQHELNRQIESETLKPILKYGLIKERIAALVTDAMRAQYLEAEGYETQILEFIDMEHTPKNILIRAVKSSGRRGSRKELRACEDLLHITPMLGKLLGQEGDKACGKND